MTPSVDLQTMIVARLKAYAPLVALVGGRVYDNPPEKPTYPHVSIGASDAIDNDADCIPGRIETVQIDCWTRDGGRLRPAKEIADQVKAALHGFAGELADHALVDMRVELMRAFMDADGLTAHGVVQVSCIVEEADGHWS